MAAPADKENSRVLWDGCSGEVSVNTGGADHVDECGSDSVYMDALGDKGPIYSDNMQNGLDHFGGTISIGDFKLVDSEVEEPLLSFNDIEIVVDAPDDFGHENVDNLLGERLEVADVAFGCSEVNESGTVSSFLEAAPEQSGQGVNGGPWLDGLVLKEDTGYADAQNNPAEQSKSIFEGGLGKSTMEDLESPPKDVTNYSVGIKSLGHISEYAARECPVEELGSPSEVVVKTSCYELLSSTSKKGYKRSGQQRRTPSILDRKTYTLRSSAAGTSISRPRVEETPNTLGVNRNAGTLCGTGGSKRRRGRRKRQMNRRSHDDFSKMRRHLKYLLHRVQYEQNLIDAYSSEGWRGQSLEKLRPEKELDRAKSAINHFKLKIRALFQRLDDMCADGRFPESLFDSEGLIDSEDIYCAKCGTMEVSSTNDIILCDGACERGFHQFCLDPPLRTEEIPPGEEGWLCPACDCKLDCIDLVNDLEGTKLSINDSWEKIFPEAATSGNRQDDSLGLPSDDSEDNDFDPDRALDDSGRNESGSTSDESDFSSASEDLRAIGRDDQNLASHSDDSEDDNYDPEVPDADEQVNSESSSSDFTSASEDLGASIADNGTSSRDGRPAPFPKLDVEQDDLLPISGRRVVERLDYKKLYDETYGNTTSDSSDDEEWIEMAGPRNKRTRSSRASSVSSDGDSPLATDSNSIVRKTKLAYRRKTSQSPDMKGAKKSHESWIGESPKASSRTMRPPPRRLGEAVTQSLYTSFKENQYPDSPTKEKLAKELGLTPKQVSKWFENARWSHNHPHPEAGTTSRGVVSKGRGKSQIKSTSPPDNKEASTSGDVACDDSNKALATSNATLPKCGSSGLGKTSLDTMQNEVQNSISVKSGVKEDDTTGRTVVLGLRSQEKATARDSSVVSKSLQVRTPRKRKASGV
ncbi:hypothetical protein Dimus_025976 [Dionaea muscipula]